MRRGRRVGPLLLSTVRQAPNAPRVDVGTAYDDGGVRYRVLVFGTGPRAWVVGWRNAGASPPALARLPYALPSPLRPAARFLFSMRQG